MRFAKQFGIGAIMELPCFALVGADHLPTRALCCGVSLLDPRDHHDVDAVLRCQFAQRSYEAEGEVSFHADTAAGARSDDVHRQAQLGPRMDACPSIDRIQPCLRLADERFNRRSE